MKLERVGITSIVIAAMAFWGAAVAIGIVHIPEALASDTSSNGCSSGTVVPDPANNPGLVSDCEVLLASRDASGGSATLNWAESVHIGQWWGVRLGGSPLRVTELRLSQKELDGAIPAELGGLAELELR